MQNDNDNSHDSEAMHYDEVEVVVNSTQVPVTTMVVNPFSSHLATALSRPVVT